jgi:enoyl-CoA hydratase
MTAERMLTISRESAGSVAVLTMNNPPLNLLTMRLRAELLEATEALSRDDDVRAVVLTAAGGRAFSVGSDIREFPTDSAAGRQRAQQEHACCDSLARLPQPIIAALEGHVLGGGLELALACDLRIATETTQLGLPEVGLGVFPSGGGSQRLPRLIPPAIAKEHMLLGLPWSAPEALRLGLVNRVVATGEALPAALALAAEIARRPARAVRAIKSAIDGGLRGGEAAGQVLEAALIADLFTSSDAQEGVHAFLNKREPQFTHQ